VRGLEAVVFTNPGGKGLHAVVRNSIVSGNSSDGIFAVSDPGQPNAFMFLKGVSVVNNGGFGVVSRMATIAMSDGTVARNGTGLGTFAGGQIISYSNNEIDNNIGADGAASGFNTPR